MANHDLKTLDGGDVRLEQDAVQSLEGSLRGRIVSPADPDYDEVRSIWNAMVDRRPGMIVRCAGAADVVRCVDFARNHGLLTAVRGGGHNIAGNAVCDGGLLIDLSGMKSVRVDTENRTVRVEPGVTLGELDNETQAFGLATPVGINSTTGVAGLTLGGGFGWLSRKHGLTVDNLLSADVVTADGKLVRASEQSHPDLFWGIRGGGGNFGVVTSFEFRLHEVGPEVLAGMIVHPLADAPQVLRQYREFAAKAPDEMTCWVVLRKAPPLPFLPEEVHGTEIIALALCYTGGVGEGERLLKPLRDYGTPHGEHVGPVPFAAFQQAFDPLLTPGARNYWKSHNFPGLDDDAIEVVLRYAASLPSGASEIFIAQMGGQTNRIAPEATAYPHRDAEFVLNVHTRWDDAKDDERCIGWAREFFDATVPFASGGVYVNFMTEEETDRIGSAYGGNYDRLAELKKTYDPGNLFRLNQNIKPGGS